MFKKSLLVLSLALMSGSVFAHNHEKSVGYELELGYSKVDFAMSDESKNLDLDSAELGLRVDFMKNYFVKGSYADLTQDVQEYEVDFGYKRELAERVALSFSVGYHVYDMNVDNIKSITTKLATHTKLNDSLTLNLGVERFDTEYSEVLKDVAVDYVAGISYQFSEDIKLSLEHRDMFKETGVKIGWSF